MSTPTEGQHTTINVGDDKMLQQSIDHLRQSVDRLNTALLGDSAMGQVGVIATLAAHDLRIKSIETRIAYVIAAGGGITMIIALMVGIFDRIKL